MNKRVKAFSWLNLSILPGLVLWTTGPIELVEDMPEYYELIILLNEEEERDQPLRTSIVMSWLIMHLTLGI